jgi:hypothetical protein
MPMYRMMSTRARFFRKYGCRECRREMTRSLLRRTSYLIP